MQKTQHILWLMQISENLFLKNIVFYENHNNTNSAKRLYRDVFLCKCKHRMNYGIIFLNQQKKYAKKENICYNLDNANSKSRSGGWNCGMDNQFFTGGLF